MIARFAWRTTVAVLHYERVSDSGTSPQLGASDVVRLQPVELPGQTEDRQRRQAANGIPEPLQHGGLQFLPVLGQRGREQGALGWRDGSVVAGADGYGSIFANPPVFISGTGIFTVRRSLAPDFRSRLQAPCRTVRPMHWGRGCSDLRFCAPASCAG